MDFGKFDTESKIHIFPNVPDSDVILINMKR